MIRGNMSEIYCVCVRACARASACTHSCGCRQLCWAKKFFCFAMNQ